jgi:hypothetical protein
MTPLLQRAQQSYLNSCNTHGQHHHRPVKGSDPICWIKLFCTFWFSDLPSPQRQ